MPETATPLLRCHGCGYEAPAGDDAWDHVRHPPFGTMTRCPECGSTKVHGRV